MSEHPLSDLLNYEHFIAPGVLGLKDGAVMCGWSYLAADLDAASLAELASVAARANRALMTLGSGMMVHVDVWHREAREYPSGGAFLATAPGMIDEERRAQYLKEGAHYESVYTIVLTWKAPVETERRLAGWFYADAPTEGAIDARIREISQIATVIEDGLSDVQMVRLDEDELRTLLHRCIVGSEGMLNGNGLEDVDVAVGPYEFETGKTINGKHIRTIAITGLPREGTLPAMLRVLNTLEFPFRWSTRWIAADPTDVQPKIQRRRRLWGNAIENFIPILRQQKGRFDDEDATDMANEANRALGESKHGNVRYGFYTGTIIIIDEDEQRVNTHAREVTRLLTRLNFASRIETLNAEDAYLGSLPGHGYQNVRRPMTRTDNLAHCLPLWSVWAGLETNPSPKFPVNSPPLAYGKTVGGVPYRFHLHVGDVGHTLIEGTTGYGKSMLLAFLIAQWQRYEGARVVCFDYDYSHEVITLASGGRHYNLLEDPRVSLYPLAHVDQEDERRWAAGWIQWLIELQGETVTPEDKQKLYRALMLLGQQRDRTFSHYVMLVQDARLKAALAPYTLTGVCGRFFDGDTDTLSTVDIQTFELSHLLNSHPLFAKAFFPLAFHHIDRLLSDERPTLIPFEEGRILQLDERLLQQYLTWLVTVRKKNGAVILTVPSLDILLSLPQCQTIMNACLTKIYLPNPEARTPEAWQVYERLGFREGEILALADATSKRQYYVTSPLGRRLVEFDFGPLVHALCGRNGPAVHRRIGELQQQFPQTWLPTWLRENKLPRLADEWATREMKRKVALKHERKEAA